MSSTFRFKNEMELFVHLNINQQKEVFLASTRELVNTNFWRNLNQSKSKGNISLLSFIFLWFHELNPL
jgi:hypothetical protein